MPFISGIFQVSQTSLIITFLHPPIKRRQDLTPITGATTRLAITINQHTRKRAPVCLRSIRRMLECSDQAAAAITSLQTVWQEMAVSPGGSARRHPSICSHLKVVAVAGHEERSTSALLQPLRQAKSSRLPALPPILVSIPLFQIQLHPQAPPRLNG